MLFYVRLIGSTIKYCYLLNEWNYIDYESNEQQSEAVIMYNTFWYWLK